MNIYGFIIIIQLNIDEPFMNHYYTRLADIHVTLGRKLISFSDFTSKDNNAKLYNIPYCELLPKLKKEKQFIGGNKYYTIFPPNR